MYFEQTVDKIESHLVSLAIIIKRFKAPLVRILARLHASPDKKQIILTQ